MIKISRLKFILLGVILIVLVAVGIILFYKPDLKHTMFSSTDSASKDSEVMLSEVQCIFTKCGFRKWFLEARCVYMDNTYSNFMVSISPKIDFFSESGDCFSISGDSGLIDTNSNKASIFGNVCGQGKEFTIKTELIDYDSNAYCFNADASVIVFDKNFCVTAGAVTVDVDSKLFHFSGNVESVFSSAVLF